MHERILKSLRKQAKHVHAWWDFTGAEDPGEEGVLEALKRLVSGVLTHPVTIGERERAANEEEKAPFSVSKCHPAQLLLTK